MTVRVDDVGTLYVDGQGVVSGLHLLDARKFNISSTSRCIGVHVINVYGSIALMVETSTGIVSDATWKCTSENLFSLAWTRADFDDSSWPHAVEIGTNKGENAWSLSFPTNRAWISVLNNHNHPFMYCRHKLT